MLTNDYRLHPTLNSFHHNPQTSYLCKKTYIKNRGIVDTLKAAIANRDLAVIKSALSAAEELSLDTKQTRKAKELLHLLKQQVAVRQKLETALDKSQAAQVSIETVAAAMKEAEAVEMRKARMNGVCMVTQVAV